MSTIEDFKNAPVAATATRDDGLLAIKIGDGERRWLTPLGTYLYDDELAILGYTLNPLVPTTAREALDLAWELAHEVKPGQVIPDGARFMEFHNSVLKEYIAYGDREISYTLAPITRTVEPLPVPLPDWLEAPAVLAECLNCNEDGLVKSVHVNFIGERWACTECQRTLPWRDLTDVTPLYPKEGQEA